VPDPEFSRDNVASFDRMRPGFIGYPTAAGCFPFWLSMASDPQAPAELRALAQAVNSLRPFLISDRDEPVPWPNAELLVVHDDEQLLAAVRKEKEKPGKDLGVPGGIRTAQTLARLGLVDEYVITHAPGHARQRQAAIHRQDQPGTTGAKTYRSGVIRATYRPAP